MSEIDIKRPWIGAELPLHPIEDRRELYIFPQLMIRFLLEHGFCGFVGKAELGLTKF